MKGKLRRGETINRGHPRRDLRNCQSLRPHLSYTPSWLGILEDRFFLDECGMKVVLPSADRENDEVCVAGGQDILMIVRLATTTATTAMLRFAGAIAGVIALFWLIRVLFDRLDKKAG